ncbi:MAG: 4-hydroxythreonine-4-phosphate dehydrogenase [Sulfurovum sp.]|nr:4-hydroxythreonine-4-phosphate dehydrogenase [Sulfurovum sp.]
MKKKKVAISIGDLNGIGIQLALENHQYVKKIVTPIYCIDQSMLKQATDKLNLSIPNNFQTIEGVAPHFEIKPGKITKESGTYAYASFVKAVKMAKNDEIGALTTLPIHKKSWELSSIKYKGHTDALRHFFNTEAIMMLGCPKMYVGLFTEHIPLGEVAGSIEEKKLTCFLVNFYKTAKPKSTIAVLGLNPHAGDNGVLGNEEKIISKAIDNATFIIKRSNPSLSTHHSLLFTKPMVPDVAFTPNVRKHYTHYVAIYHDQGLAPLKALYFDEGINVSLNLPILRTSVDHGTAFDIAYKKGIELNRLSYLNAIRYIVDNR